MTAIDSLVQLRTLVPGIFQTSDAATSLGVSIETASKILGRLHRKKLLIRLLRGRWALPENNDPLSIPEHLTAPWPSYVSLQTALFYHGFITQIPSRVYAVSLSRTRTYQNEIGTFSIHQIKPDFFHSFETVGATGVKLATPEKALLDVLYLSPARSHLFKTLPEIELPDTFRVTVAREIIRKMTDGRRKSLLEAQFEDILKRI